MFGLEKLSYLNPSREVRVDGILKMNSQGVKMQAPRFPALSRQRL
jgi:hypothetical protein